MPTVSLKQGISEDEVMAAIRTQLGSAYKVDAKDGDKDVIAVAKGTISTAHVRLERSTGGTTAHIHGGGLIISRMINEMGIANKVAQALKDSPGVASG